MKLLKWKNKLQSKVHLPTNVSSLQVLQGQQGLCVVVQTNMNLPRIQRHLVARKEYLKFALRSVAVKLQLIRAP